MTTFIYRRIDNGKELLMPELWTETEKLFPNHRKVIDHVLSIRGNMKDWTIVIDANEDNPDRLKGFGLLLDRLNTIVLGVAIRDEMVLSLLHEIVHYLHPELHDHELEVEKIALEWYGKKSSWFYEVHKEK